MSYAEAAKQIRAENKKKNEEIRDVDSNLNTDIPSCSNNHTVSNDKCDKEQDTTQSKYQNRNQTEQKNPSLTCKSHVNDKSDLDENIHKDCVEKGVLIRFVTQLAEELKKNASKIDLVKNLSEMLKSLTAFLTNNSVEQGECSQGKGENINQQKYKQTVTNKHG